MSDLDFHYADNPDEDSTLVERDEGPAFRSAAETLAELALRDALGTVGSRAIRKPGIAVVLACPDATWVEPLKAACAGLGWSAVFARTGSSRLDDRPDKGNDIVRTKLARGGRVLGISQDPRGRLPSALILSADLVVEVTLPSPRLIGEVIKAACGRSPKTPPGPCAGLTFDEIVAQIRMNAPPRVAVTRLSAAVAAKVVRDPAVADAPPFEELVGYGEQVREWGSALIRSANAYRAGEAALCDLSANRAMVVAGPPGCGKTTLFASVARSAQLTLVRTSVAQWFAGQGYLGDVVRASNDAFAAALAAAPSILLIDEIDALPRRDGLHPDRASFWNTATANILLQVTETLAHPTKFVAIVAATNHPEVLDPALVRPGRLDRVVTIGAPSPTELAAIVRQHLRGDLPDADLAVVGELGAGSFGAAAAGWVAQARAKSQVARRPMAFADLIEAVAPPDPRTPEQIWRTAIHEAGHACAIEVLPAGAVETVSVVLREGEGGRTTRVRREAPMDTRAEIEAEVVALLAGRAAETCLLGTAGAGGGGSEDSDLARATMLVARVHGNLGLAGRLTYHGSDADIASTLRFDRELARLVEDDLARLMAAAVALVETRRETVARVADALVARRVLDAAALRQLLAEDGPRSSAEVPWPGDRA